jgi:hypothetical protein
LRQFVVSVVYWNGIGDLKVGGLGMEYRQFVIQAFEEVPGKWRAKISRSDGKPLTLNGQRAAHRFINGFSATTAANALLLAMEAIDRGTIATAEKAPIEKFWRRASTIELA